MIVLILLEFDEDLAGLDAVSGLHVDLGDLARHGRGDVGLHLHRFEHEQRIVA